MKRKWQVISWVIFLFSISLMQAQTFTMGKKCQEIYQRTETALEQDAYQEALNILVEFSDECKTRDARELRSVAKAEAYNGLGQYDDAIREADLALDATKGESLNAWFQKGIAQNKKGDIEASRSSLEKVMSLTEMNQNTPQRASNYALMGALYSRQLNQPDSAFYYLNKAKELDPGNPDFMIQEGDIYVHMNQYDKAFQAYDNAQAAGKDDLEIYIIKSEARLKQMEHQYGTTNAQELKSKMTTQEKEVLCTDMKKAIDMGWRDMNKDMFVALVCN
ncbi:tetratricopeptide repeat protein [Gramella sp. BOM4]|nr:tetratricopeptide repeat protein [Christiangramia bathymodioli]